METGAKSAEGPKIAARCGESRACNPRLLDLSGLYLTLVAEWLHFKLVGEDIKSPRKLKVYTFLGLMNSETKLNPYKL